MAIRLGANRYGKAENRVVRIHRDTARHEISDLNVSTAPARALRRGAHDRRPGDVLPTDTQKNTAFAFAKDHGVRSIEDYALRLAHHFVDTAPAVSGALVEVEEYPWNRDRRPRPRLRARRRLGSHHGGRRGGRHGSVVTSGVKDLTLLKSTGSEFHGFLRDQYTTLRGDQRPDPRDVAGRHVAVRHDRGRLGSRRSPTSRALHARDSFARIHSPGAAADALRHG